MKKAINYVILILLIGTTLWILIDSNDLSDLPSIIKNTNKIFLIISFLSLLLFWICDGYIIYKMKKILSVDTNFISSMKLSMIGQYYSSITPFATGGQPAQIYSLVNDGIPLGVATSLLINKFLIYQLVVTFYAIIMFVFKFKFLYDKSRVALSFIILGCFINFLGIVIVIGLFLNEKLIKNLLIKLFELGHKLKLVSDIDKAIEKLNNSLADYMDSIKIIKQNKISTMYLILITTLQLTFYFSITYFVYLAIGLKRISYLDIIAIQSLHYMAISFMPTPGTAGASEGGFYILFKTLFPNKILSYATLLWRIIDYYLRLLISGVVTLIDYIYQKRKKLKPSN
ncbi:flippase-like domain-containing protein [Tissierella carlieri]|uniref:lysylphosphatidylglycerol synthase transmembrane domain-containing protein n=1 Tax=Tissierella carlieri TaxID=689904 RepID=UPI001C11E5FD|nr:lysylphosphatidylglycerol synthase transmembrane domain-containing protein [Tissierella carlieri]MBU5313060.1 flippase-like domain-containing protein [Tissierella carlieri]